MRARSAFRLISLLVAFLMSLGVMTGRLFWLQVMGKDRFQALAAVQRERRNALPAQRGSIFDRNGADLGISIEMSTVSANPHFIADASAAAALLSPIIGIDQSETEQKLRRQSGFVFLARKIEPALGAKVKALQIPGISVVSESKRVYPSGQLASHIVGFTGFENSGLAGLEGAYNKLLAGEPGYSLSEIDTQGRPIPSGKSVIRQPVAGSDLHLTIDKQIQFVAETALARGIEAWGAKGGTVIVMNPRTGEILAMANLPTFDPNDVKSSAESDRRNRALIDIYEPGSANKVILAAAALEAGTVRPTDVMRVPDNLKIGTKVFNDAHSHAVWDISFAEVMRRSSNVGVIKVAQQIGKERLYESLLKFGYGKPTGLGFPGEGAGIVPKPNTWSSSSLPTIAIGQGVAVTAMQIMQVYGTVANGGMAVSPRLVVGDATPARRVISQITARQLAEILIGVTEDKYGTGHAAAIDGYQVAGKTGTAQKPRTDAPGYSGYIGSFIGFAPAADPKLVVGVILDEPSPIWGGVTAAPIFKEVMQFALRRLGIGPGSLLPREGVPSSTPDRSGDVVQPSDAQARTSVPD